MAIRVATARKIADAVIDAIRQMTGLNVIDSTMSLVALGFSFDAREALYQRLGKTVPGLSETTHRAFQRAKTVSDIVNVVTDAVRHRRTAARDQTGRGGGHARASSRGSSGQGKIGRASRSAAGARPPRSAKGKPKRKKILRSGADSPVIVFRARAADVAFGEPEAFDERSSRRQASSGRGRSKSHNALAHELVVPRDSERRIGVWIGGEASPQRSLTIGRTYSLNFKVGRLVAESMVVGADGLVPESDVPVGGLPTNWVVVSRDAELGVGSPGTAVSVTMIDAAETWTGRFDLLIPKDGDSAVLQLRIKPLKRTPRLQVVITVRGDLYRQFQIVLRALDVSASKSLAAARIVNELQPTPTAHMGILPTHEWTTPAGVLALSIMPPFVSVDGAVGSEDVHSTEQWIGSKALVTGPIQNVREAAEELRAAWEIHLNDISPDDLVGRLQRWGRQSGGPEYDWSALGNYADRDHNQRWEKMAVSLELRKLAYQGRRLFQACFGSGSNLSEWIPRVSLGSRLNITWLPSGVGEFIPHMPWGLMYLADLPPGDQPIDPMNFLGLRCRLAYTSHRVNGVPRSLGALDATHRAHFLYWGDATADVTAQEARWQRSKWGAWKNQVFVPQSAQNGKAELLRLLDDPQPAPTSLIYLFCQCSVGQGNNPALRFGPTNDPANIVQQTDFTTSKLPDRPFVFANACTTATSDPNLANELEELFFLRGCSAYLGTETKVPIVLGSRFASLFFHFFYRLLDPAPMGAGEAVVQTRLFLWTHYRNIGGLFYSQVNMYDLFMARNDEVLALRPRRKAIDERHRR